MQTNPSSDVREVGDRFCSPWSILGESTWDERWSNTGGSPGNYEHRNPTYKDATGLKDLKADPAAVIDMSEISELLRNRPDPSPWGQYKADMTIKLNMKNGLDLTVSGLYRIAGVDCFFAKEKLFSSATTLRLADMEGLPGDNTVGSLNTKSLTEVRQQLRETAPPNRKGEFLVETKPNNKHDKRCRQFMKPPGQSAGKYSSDYPRNSSVEGDERRYAHLESPKGDNLFAAYDPQEKKLGKS